MVVVTILCFILLYNVVAADPIWTSQSMQGQIAYQYATRRRESVDSKTSAKLVFKQVMTNGEIEHVKDAQLNKQFQLSNGTSWQLSTILQNEIGATNGVYAFYMPALKSNFYYDSTTGTVTQMSSHKRGSVGYGKECGYTGCFALTTEPHGNIRMIDLNINRWSSKEAGILCPNGVLTEDAYYKVSRIDGHHKFSYQPENLARPNLDWADDRVEGHIKTYTFYTTTVQMCNLGSMLHEMQCTEGFNSALTVFTRAFNHVYLPRHRSDLYIFYGTVSGFGTTFKEKYMTGDTKEAKAGVFEVQLTNSVDVIKTQWIDFSTDDGDTFIISRD